MTHRQERACKPRNPAEQDGSAADPPTAPPTQAIEEPRRQRRRGTSRRPACNMRQIPRIMNGTKVTRSASTFKSELIQIKFAHADRTGRLEARGDLGILSGNTPAKHLTRSGSLNAGGVDIVFKSDRNAPQRIQRLRTASPSLVASSSVRQSAVLRNRNKAIQPRVKFLDASQAQFRQFFRRDRPALQRSGSLSQSPEFRRTTRSTPPTNP